MLDFIDTYLTTFIFTGPDVFFIILLPAATCTLSGFPTSVNPVPYHYVFCYRPAPTTIPPEVACLLVTSFSEICSEEAMDKSFGSAAFRLDLEAVVDSVADEPP